MNFCCEGDLTCRLSGKNFVSSPDEEREVDVQKDSTPNSLLSKEVWLTLHCITLLLMPLYLFFMYSSLSCLRWTEFKSLFPWLLLSTLSLSLFLRDVSSITNFLSLCIFISQVLVKTRESKVEREVSDYVLRGESISLSPVESSFLLVFSPIIILHWKSKSWNLPRKVSLIHSMQSNYKRDQRSLLLLELDEEEGMPMLTSLSLFSCVLSCGWFLSSSLCLLPLGSWRGCRKKGRRCCDDFPSRMQGILLPESFIFAFMSFTFSRLWIV